jgi:F-type H+-transporting ATPase subunit b
MAQPAQTYSETAVPGQPGAPAASFPPFASETFVSQLLWFAITFGLLYYLMAKVALPRVAGILENRENRIAADLSEAEALRTESEAAGEAYEKSLAQARNNAKAIAQETRDRLTAESEVRRKVLEAELATKLAESEAFIREQTTQAMSNVRGIAADAATAIVERLTGQAPERAFVESALDRTLAR